MIFYRHNWFFHSKNFFHLSRIINVFPYLCSTEVFNFPLYCLHRKSINFSTMHSHFSPSSPFAHATQKNWLPIIFFSNCENKIKFTTEAISQKWKMNFGKSDALNSGDCCWLYYFRKKKILSKEIKLYNRSTFLFQNTHKKSKP